MVDLGSIQAALGSLKIASDILGSMKDLRDAAKLQSLTIDLQAAILDAQRGAIDAQLEQTSLIDRIRALEEEVARMKAWDAEKERYALTDLGNGRFVYTLKDSADTAEPEHHLCQNCFNHGQKSILQKESLAVGRTKLLVCHSCNAELITRGLRHEGHKPRVVTQRPK